jgi:choline dehydrogenase
MVSAVGLGIMGSPLKSRASDPEFDYIVVGGGAAGCIVARRLSDNGSTVLLLEAGRPDFSSDLVPPLPFLPFPQETVNDAIRSLQLHSLFSLWPPPFGAAPEFVEWGFDDITAQTPNPLIAGRVLGGGSSINGRIFFRGDPRNYDHWASLGNEGWGYEDVLPYFKKLEDYKGPHPTNRGSGGLIPILIPPFQSPAAHAIVEAAADLGFDDTGDFANKQEDTVGFTESNTVPVGDPTDPPLTRASTAIRYLHPIIGQSKNFTLRTRALTRRVLFERGRAIGVEYIDRRGRIHTVRATVEVVLSAGAYNTPKLLMLSGVGPAEHLRSFGIPVLVDLPGVGQNLQDHTYLSVGFSLDQGLDFVSALTQNQTISEANLFTKVLSDSDSSDLQLFGSGFTVSGTPGVTLSPVTSQQRSVGSVTLRSIDPQDKPVIIHNFLQSDQDVTVLLAGVDLCRELFHQKAFDDLRGSGKELPPSAGLTNKKDLTEEFLRKFRQTDWHPSCSCRMGHDQMAVVDPQLHVHGLDGLRVVDASVMPRIVSGNIHGTVCMIGEKGADMIINGLGADMILTSQSQ